MTGAEFETAVGVAVVAEAVSASVATGSAPEDRTLGHCSLRSCCIPYHLL